MRMDEAIINAMDMYPNTSYVLNTYKYLSLDGKQANAVGMAALGIGFKPEEFRALVNEGMGDAFVYTSRSEIWYVLHRVWPWLTNDDFLEIAKVEQFDGLLSVLKWIDQHQPAADDQIEPLPRPKMLVIPQAPLSQPVVQFTREQIMFIGRSLNVALFKDDGQESILEGMASQFEHHVPGFNPADFYNPEVNK